MASIRAAGVIVGLVGVALSGSACGVGMSPNRAIVPERKPVVLTMASPLTTSEQLDVFVREVSVLTGGTVHIDVKSGWRNGQIDYETRLIADVEAGKADLGVASGRAFDSAGVLGFRALVAPLLITSYTAEEQVLGGPIAAGMVNGLDTLGLAGIGILPGDLRRPFGVTVPLVTPADYAGRIIGTQQSNVADQTMRALGATPVRFPVPGDIDGFDGVEQQVTSIQGFEYDKVGKFLTANVALWPRSLVVFANGKAFGRLSATQRQALKRAAIAALPGSMSVVRDDESESMADLCRAHRLTVDTASPADLAALRTAVQPVYDSLERDPQTKQAIAAITATLQSLTPEPPPTCDLPEQSPTAVSTLLDGVYTMSTTFADKTDDDDDPVPENFGQYIFVLRDGHFADTQMYQNACTWGYGTFTIDGARMEWTFADGGGVSPNNALNKSGEFFVFGWNLYRDTLTLTPVAGAISPGNFRLKPWHRISTTPSAKFFSKRCPPPANALG